MTRDLRATAGKLRALAHDPSITPGHAAALTGKARELSGLHDQAVRDRAATMPSPLGTRQPVGPHGRPVRARRACDGRRPRTRAHRRARRARGGAGLMRWGPGARANSRLGGAEKRPPGPEREIKAR